ncbi:hypothetical protein GUL16_15820 [Stenotrophomonas maltophilia]|nr:hypothetical protein [Stenotrophomonas maltophilia]
MHDRIRERYEAVQKSTEALRGSTDHLKEGGGGGDDGDMEARIAKLEVAVEYIQRDVAEIKADLKTTNEALRGFGNEVNGELRGLATDVAAVKERLAHTPTTLQMWGAVAAIIAPIGAALWWIVQQYLGPLLSKAAGL